MEIIELKNAISKLKTQRVSSMEDWREQRKESINSNAEQKLSSLFNKEKIHWKNKQNKNTKHILRDLDCNKRYK